MPRQAGQASNELMDGLEAMHHVRFAEARALFLEGIKKDSNCASCYLNLGNAYFHEPNFGKARWSYEMGLKLNPINSDLKNNNNVNKAYIDGYIELPKNNLIDIPFMEIHSTAIDIAGAGTHSFDNEMDYEFKILLNEILGDKFRRKHKKKVSEFGVVQDDGVKGMTMFLKMQGTVDDPQISYNTLRLRESLSDGFNKEKKELKDVIKNQFKDKNNDNHIQGNPDYDNIIEWEE